MTILLLHGVPETPVVWDPLRRALGRSDVIAPSLPGFGRPRPVGFGATKEEYVEWLIAQFESHGEPVDAVGHDWGGGFLLRLVSLRPDLVRSWVLDVGGLGHESFEWHALAKIFQTPGAGEEFFEQQLATPVETRAATMAALGVPLADASAIAAGIDATMAACILDLYRSAVDVGHEWGPAFKDIPKPGSVLVPADDPFLPPEGARAGASGSGAGIVPLDGLGHWWMLQDPQRSAAVLNDFWATRP